MVIKRDGWDDYKIRCGKWTNRFFFSLPIFSSTFYGFLGYGCTLYVSKVAIYINDYRRGLFSFLLLLFIHIHTYEQLVLLILHHIMCCTTNTHKVFFLIVYPNYHHPVDIMKRNIRLLGIGLRTQHLRQHTSIHEKGYCKILL